MTWLLERCTWITSAWLALASLASAQPGSEADYQLYVEVMSGKRAWESLTVEQIRSMMLLHQALSAGRCDDVQSEECCDARSRAKSAASDLASTSRRLTSCAESGSDYDDCSSEFSRVKRTYSDFEDSFSSANVECR